MENNILSFSRFSRYIVAYLYNTRRQLLAMSAIILGLSLLFTLGVPALSDVYDTPSLFPGIDRMWGVEMNFFNVLLLVFAAVCAAKIFGIYSGKSGKIRNLMFPASTFEKFLTYFLIYVIGFYLVFMFCTFFADFMRVLIYKHTAIEGATVRPIPLDYILSSGVSESVKDGFRISDEEEMRKYMFEFNSFMGLVLITQAFFALGSSIWQKNTRLKTTLAGIAILSGSIFLAALGFEVFFKNIYGINLRYRLNWNFETIITVFDIIVITITLFMYWLSFRRFKEMEVINRW